ncbi:methyltransferase [Nocardia brasiliensis]|uniref:methyltransferase n=1 Tax=Nocardia brasiliensis TaxID=37326 RepID=UPI00366CECA7
MPDTTTTQARNSRAELPIATLAATADYAFAFAVRAVARLGVADHLGDGRRHITELAEAVGAQPDPLYRLLRALAVKDVFAEPRPKVFELMPSGQLLRTEHPFSLRDVYSGAGADVRAWGAFDYSLRTGAAAFDRVHGCDFATYRSRNPIEDAELDRAQHAGTRLDLLTLIRGYPWAAARTVVDVGGGTGALIFALLQRFSAMRGTLFDLPHVVAQARPEQYGADVAERCVLVGGDFFDSVPAGADMYVLKTVVGGWDDEHVVAILRTVRAAMRQDSTLVVLEPIMGYGEEFTLGNVVHLRTLLLYGGLDRTMDDYNRLLASARLRPTRVIPRVTLPIIEVVAQ